MLQNFSDAYDYQTCLNAYTHKCGSPFLFFPYIEAIGRSLVSVWKRSMCTPIPPPPVMTLLTRAP